MIDYLAENGLRIPIIRQLSINGSVKVLGIPDFPRGSGLLFITNLKDPTDPTGWRHGGTSNQNWAFIPGGHYRNTRVTLGTTVPDCLDYTPRSLVNLHAAAHHIQDDFLCNRHHGCTRSPSTSHNPIVNPRINFRGEKREGLVNQ